MYRLKNAMYNDGRGIVWWQKKIEGNFLGWKKYRRGIVRCGKIMGGELSRVEIV